MGKLIRALFGVAVSVVSLASASASAGDFMDTRLSFVFADDNVLAKSGESTPNSPNAGFGAGNQNTQFYDNFNTRFSGFETLSNIALYKKSAGFFEGLTTEAAFNILVLERPSGGIDLRDNSSYITLTYRPQSWSEKEGFTLTGFPVSADRFRLGYVYRISWGGSSIFTNRAVADGVPGVRLGVQKERWFAFLGAKSALVTNDLVLEKERLYGFLGGAGADITETIRVEANGGYFQKGIVPGLAVLGVEAPVNALGGSAQVVYHVGEPVGQSVDLRLYKNDPEIAQRFFRPESYNPGGPASYIASIEGSYLVQTLEDPNTFARTVPQSAQAVAFQARLKKNYIRAHALALYRSLSFIQFDVPGFPPFKDFPDGTVLKPEIFGAVGVDYHLPSLHLTPGVIVGVQQPATFTAPETLLGGNNPPAGLTGSRTVVVRDANLFSILPTGSSAIPILSAKTTFRWDLSEYVAAIGEVYYTRDPNRVTFKDDATGVAQPSFEKEHQLGFNTLVQARF